MEPGLITLTTHFGVGSPYVAAMKGVILGIAPRASIVDITHGIPAQNIAAGAFALTDFTRFFPAGSIHVGVVNPGVGTGRRILAARIDDRNYVAPDNGLLDPLLNAARDVALVVVDQSRWWRSQVSATFHGRDIMAPVAAHWACGLEASELGSPVDRWSPLDWPAVQQSDEQLVGSVVFVDDFGNIISDLSRDQVTRWAGSAPFRIRCGPRVISRWVGTYGESSPGELVALFGSTGRLEVARVNGNAARELKVVAGPTSKMIVERAGAWPTKGA